MPAVGSFGPFDTGGDLVRDWTYVGGILAPDVAAVRLTLRNGGQLDVPTTSIDDIGFDAGSFFVPLEPGVVAAELVALDGQGLNLDVFPLEPVEDPVPPGGPPAPSG
ncbi:MAG: hypothetical protein ACRDFY_08740 [Candidatus Limnocylindria bacterium]